MNGDECTWTNPAPAGELSIDDLRAAVWKFKEQHPPPPPVLVSEAVFRAEPIAAMKAAMGAPLHPAEWERLTLAHQQSAREECNGEG